MVYFGDIKPRGWLRQMLQENLDGCIGNLDRLVPDLILEHDIYNKDRIGATSQMYQLGRCDEAEDGLEENEIQFFWWNSETQSNWRDGFCRSAMLLEDEAQLARVKDYLKKVAAGSDNGYLGIYAPDLRFACKGENGELWSHSTLFRVLLGCWEYFREPEIWELLTKGADRLMEGYPMGASHPFCLEEPFGGVAHGLTVTDAFDRIYQITGERKYLDYARWLYEEFSAYWQSEDDLQIKNVEDRNKFFRSHGVHTYEHFRALIIASQADPSYRRLLEIALVKLSAYLTPTGGPIGDEWIHGRFADATETGYEFCSVHELLHTYAMLLEKTGEMEWADRMEWLYWNAAMGMKHPDKSAIMYLKADNCYTADERRSPDTTARNPRYKYSPTHRDAAVCCVPNFGRILPYFIQSAIVQNEEGFDICQYQPVEFRGEANGTPVMIRISTDYPRVLQATVEIQCQAPSEFTVALRFPKWAKAVTVEGVRYLPEEALNGKIVLKREWFRDQISVEFDCDVVLNRDRRGDYFVSRGPLVYALEIPSQEYLVKECPLPGFSELGYRSLDRSLETLRLKEADFAAFCYNGNGATWEAVTLSAILRKGSQVQQCVFRPVGRTILRKVTFRPCVD